MKIFKPKFWDKKNIFSILLLPLSYIVLLYIFIKKKITKKIHFGVPIVCVGNIFLGGTGKTPLAINLAQIFLNKGKKPAIIRKFYENHKDEHLLIRKYFKDLILNKDRVKAINEAEKEGYNFLILDDGFQDHRIKKNINIICFNQKQLVGNGLVLPAGPLRETLNSLKDAHIVIINGEKDREFEKKILKINESIEIFYSKYKADNTEEFRNKELMAVAGIGNPDNFFDLLLQSNLNVKEKLIYPDHYRFSKYEVLKMIEISNKKKLQILMTEKDYFKIKDFDLKEIQFLKINLIIEKQEKLIEKILRSYD